MRTKSSILRLLRPYTPLIHECIQQGWKDAQTIYAGTLDKHSSITRPNLIRDHILDHVRNKFGDIENVAIIEKVNLFLLCIDWKVLVKFKKLNKDLSTCNIPTRQVKQYVQQTLFDEVLEDATYLHAGYVPNAFWTDIEGIYLTCPDGSNILWSEQIDCVESVKDIDQINKPVISTIEKKRVHVIGAKDGEEANEEGTGS